MRSGLTDDSYDDETEERDRDRERDEREPNPSSSPLSSSRWSRWTRTRIFVRGGYPTFLAATVLGTAAFLGLPGFSGLLYAKERVTNPTGISANEWIWTLLTSLWIGAAFRLPPPSRKSSSWWNSKSLPRRSRFRGLARRSTVRGWFLAVNALWMIVPLVGYEVRRRRRRQLDEDEDEEETWTAWTVRWIDVVGGKSAWPALWNVAAVCVPIQRASPILASMGISSNRAVEGHVWAANAALVWLLTHAVLLSLAYAVRTGGSFNEWRSLMVPYGAYYTEGAVNFAGWVGLACFVGLWAFSRPSIRDRSHEAFKVLHWIFAALFLLGSNLHDYSTFFFVQPSVVLTVADYLLRRHSSFVAVATAAMDRGGGEDEEDDDDDAAESSPSPTARQAASLPAAMTTTSTTTTMLLSAPSGGDDDAAAGNLCALTLPIPEGWPRRRLRTEPGFHVYLTVPGIAGWQSHAYSISAVDAKRGTFSIHAKALGGWSRALVDRVRDGSDGSGRRPPPLSLSIEGPYPAGAALLRTVLSCRHCVFLAGGVGITGVAALAGARCRDRSSSENHDEDAAATTTTTTTTTLLWMVPTRAEARFLLPLLRDNDDVDGGGGDLPDGLRAHVWITRENDDRDDAWNDEGRDGGCGCGYASLSDSGAEEEEEAGAGAGADRTATTMTTTTIAATIVAGDGRRTGPAWIVVAASIAASALAMVASRWVCALQPPPPQAEDDENEGDLPYRVRECTLLGRSSICRSCEIEDVIEERMDRTETQQSPLPPPPPCCTTPVCQVCFRGVPMVLLLLVAPLLAVPLARFLRAAWLRTFGAGGGGGATMYDAIDYDDRDDDDDDNDRDEIEIRGGRCRDGDVEDRTSSSSRAGSEGSRRRRPTFHHGKRPATTAELMSVPHLPPAVFDDDDDDEVVVVVCGPPGLAETARRDLSIDPLRKRWRVIEA